MDKKTQESYADCRRIARRSASSFFLSFLLLPKPQRNAMCALYAFLRYTDDIADNPAPLEERRLKLRQWRMQFDDALAGRCDSAILPAVADTIQRFKIPQCYFHDAIDGAEMDLVTNRYETFDELDAFCYRAASVVGLACLRIWGCDDPQAAEPARKCGVAFQLTNILRDIAEDAERGRIYLPLEDIAHFDCTEEDILQRRHSDRIARLICFEANRARSYYIEAARLETLLPRDGRRAWRVMMTTYRAILDELWRRDYNVFGPRVRLSRWQRLSLVARGLWSPQLPWQRQPVAAVHSSETTG